MKTVKLLLNIGKPDAMRLGLDPVKALVGESVSVEDAAADEMLRKGWATDRRDEAHPALQAEPHGSAGLPSGPHGTDLGALGKPAGAEVPIGAGGTSPATPKKDGGK